MISQALLNLAPGAEWVCDGTKITQWMSPDIAQPSQEEIDAEVARLRAEYDSKEYARLRQAEYPSIEECIHAILDDDLDALQAKRADVKARYPK